MKATLLGILVTLCLATSAAAQAATAQWTSGTDPVTAQSYTYTLKNGTTVVAIGLVTCATVNSVTQCSAPITGAASAGTYTLTAANTFGSVVSDPFVGSAPGKPLTFKIG